TTSNTKFSTLAGSSGGIYSYSELSPTVLADDYRIEDRMQHRMDKWQPLTTGLITWVSGNVYVTTPDGALGVGSTDSDVQRGVDSASAGGTVNVEAGLYHQFPKLIIRKDLTLLGAKRDIPALGRSGLGETT